MNLIDRDVLLRDIVDSIHAFESIGGEYSNFGIDLLRSIKRGIEEYPVMIVEPTESLGGDVQTNLYDVEEVHEDCTVQVLRNTATGEISIGWWKV